ncbi:MAG: hypothetical protein ACO3A2_10790 [Bdellovibrionia bacterium]
MQPNAIFRRASIVMALGLWVPLPAWAFKLDMTAGAFAVDAKTSKANGSLSNFGIYRFQFSYPFTSQIEGGVGYTVIMSNGIGGDLGYGLDLSASYYPLTHGSPSETQLDGSRVDFTETWKPFIGVSFNQRQFQSIQTGYAGFGVSIGVERHYEKSLSFIGSVSYRTLTGSQSATATELSGVLGVSLFFNSFR